MGRSKNTWRGSDGRPPFEVGDWVRPNGNYAYQGWKSREPRMVEAVNYDEMQDRWTLEIKNPMSPYNGYSNYTPRNMEHVDNTKRVLAEFYRATGVPQMTYERTKFIGIKAAGGDNKLEHIIDNTPEITEALNSQHEVRVEIAKRIKHGDRWLVVQTVAMIEGEEPRPPIRVTEYK